MKVQIKKSSLLETAVNIIREANKTGSLSESCIAGAAARQAVLKENADEVDIFFLIDGCSDYDQVTCAVEACGIFEKEGLTLGYESHGEVGYQNEEGIEVNYFCLTAGAIRAYFIDDECFDVKEFYKKFRCALNQAVLIVDEDNVKAFMSREFMPMNEKKVLGFRSGKKSPAFENISDGQSFKGYLHITYDSCMML
jgi:hypothetical protein